MNPYLEEVRLRRVIERAGFGRGWSQPPDGYEGLSPRDADVRVRIAFGPPLTVRVLRTGADGRIDETERIAVDPDRIEDFLKRVIDEPGSILPPVDRDTESVAETRRRIGQARFKADLVRLRGGRCEMTGVTVPALLKGSHVVPWAEASDRERLDPDNGVLLAAHADALFDAHLITFEDDGTVLVARSVVDDFRRLFPSGASGVILTPGRRDYVRRHRDRAVSENGGLVPVDELAS